MDFVLNNKESNEKNDKIRDKLDELFFNFQIDLEDFFKNLNE